MLSPELEQLFTSSTYSIEGLGDLFIGEHIPDAIVSWVKGVGHSTLSMIGAENPNATLVTQDENDRLHAALIQACRDEGLIWLPASGRGDDWQERGVAIAGLSREQTLQLRDRYSQAAVLFSSVDGRLEMI